MDYNKAALELHSKFPGKIAVQSLCECKDRDALSTAYTPGVAEPCRKIKANPDDVYTYTMKGRTVAVVTERHCRAGSGQHRPRGRPAGHGGQVRPVQGVRRRRCVPHLPERQDEGGGHRCGQGHRPDASAVSTWRTSAAPSALKSKPNSSATSTSPCSTTTSTAQPSSCWRVCSMP